MRRAGRYRRSIDRAHFAVDRVHHRELRRGTAAARWPGQHRQRRGRPIRQRRRARVMRRRDEARLVRRVVGVLCRGDGAHTVHSFFTDRPIYARRSVQPGAGVETNHDHKPKTAVLTRLAELQDAPRVAAVRARRLHLDAGAAADVAGARRRRVAAASAGGAAPHLRLQRAVHRVRGRRVRRGHARRQGRWRLRRRVRLGVSLAAGAGAAVAAVTLRTAPRGMFQGMRHPSSWNVPGRQKTIRHRQEV